MKEFDFDNFSKSLEEVFHNIKHGIEAKANEKAVDGEIIGTGRSDYTQDVTGYTLYKDGKQFVLYDVPGIEGNESAYEDIIRKAVNKAHIVFYVNSDTKKVEPKTAEKIKKYLRNDTDVYSVINVHLPPKAQRVAEIDGTYQDEIAEAFKKDEQSIKPQTEETLKTVLGKNFRSGILINGLQAFSASAFDRGIKFSTIIQDTEDKNLRSNQKKFFAEYSDDVDSMQKESNIDSITKIIDDHAGNFQEFIIESNKKKLIARLNDSYEKISNLKNDSIKFVGKFIDAYTEIKESVSKAESNFTSFMKRGYIENAVQNVINTELGKMYELIEAYEGKLSEGDYQHFFDSRKEEMENAIQNNLKEGYEEAVTDFKSSIEEAQNRFGTDIANLAKFASVHFPAIQNMDFKKISMEMKFSGKDFGGALLKVGGLAYSGFLVGSIFPGIGNVIGAVIGTLTGLLFAVVDFLMGKARKIAKAKAQAKGIFDNIADNIIEELEKSFQFDKYIEDIKKVSSNIQNFCDTEIKKFEMLEKNLNKLVKYINTKKTNLMELKYGTL